MTTSTAYFARSPSRFFDPAIDPVSLWLAEGIPLGNRAHEESAPSIHDEVVEPLEFAMNVYRLPELFYAGPLIISERVANGLLACSVDVKLVEARMVRAFNAPNEPWNHDHDRFINRELMGPGPLMFDALERNECDVPKGKYYEVIPHRSGTMRREDLDAEVDIPLEPEGYVIDAFTKVRLSKRWLKEYGLYAAGPFVMREDVADFVWPFLTLPYIHFGRYEW